MSHLVVEGRCREQHVMEMSGTRLHVSMTATITVAPAALRSMAMCVRLHSGHWFGWLLSALFLSSSFTASICSTAGNGSRPFLHQCSQQPRCRVCGEARTDGH